MIFCTPKKIPEILPVVSFCLVLFFFSNSAFAAFNLTALPTEGGFDLRFSRLSPESFKEAKEIALQITSDIGKQYRVLQQVIQPLTTPEGIQLPSDQFRMYPLVNSNSKGTLIYREETPVSEFDSILYTSNNTGESDLFQLVYTLTPKENQIPGSYYGRIAYILAPVDSTESQVVVTVNVYAELTGGATPVIELVTDSGEKRLSFSSKGMGIREEATIREYPELLVRIHGPLGLAYKIYQSFEGGRVVSDEGKELELSNISFSVSGGDKGAVMREGNLQEATHRQLLYVSDGYGSADEFSIIFKPNSDIRFQKAGRYIGRLNFFIETEKERGLSPEIINTLEIEFDIEPLFDIYVYSGELEGVALKFGEVSFKTGPKTSEVDVYVESNMGKSYQVIQNVAAPMMNENLDKIPEEDFTVRLKDLDVKEEPKFYLKEAVAVKEGGTVLFASGPSGASSHFKAEYYLVMRPDTRAGNYSTRIEYSLSVD